MPDGAASNREALVTNEVKRAIAAGGTRRPGRRFPDGAKEVLIRYAAEQRSAGRTTASIARELGLSVATLGSWSEHRPSFVPVTVVSAAPTGLVVRGPHGLAIEGLDVEGLAQLLRLLS